MKRWQRLLLAAFCYYYSTLNGLFSVHYEARYGRLVSTPRRKWYVRLRNACSVLLLVAYVQDALANANFFGASPIAKSLRLFTTVQSSSCLFFIIVGRGHRQRRLLPIVRTLLRLERELFVGYACLSSEELRHIDHLWFGKLALMLLHTVLVMLANLTSLQLDEWPQWLLFFVDMDLMNLYYGVMFHFCLVIWHIAGRCALLNIRLGQLHAAAPHCDVSLELWLLYRTHAQLDGLIRQLFDIYKWHIAFALSMYMANVISLGYHVILVVRRRAVVRIFNLVIGGIVYWLLLADMYVLDSLSECLTAQSELGSRLLRRFAEYDDQIIGKDTSLGCDWFALHLSWRRLRLVLCNVIVVNRQTTFVLISQILLHTIIIVQSDYWNLTNK